MRRSRQAYAVNDLLELIDKSDSQFEFSDGDSEEEYLLENDQEVEECTNNQQGENSSDESDGVDIDNVPLVELQKRKNSSSSSQKKYAYRWRSHGFDAPEVPFLGEECIVQDPEPSPLEFFHQFVSSEMIKNICEQTNVYSVEKDGASVDTAVNELEKLIGMYFLMGLIQLPSVRGTCHSVSSYC
ncbi:uncharacterized protein LOC124451001 [Xenia sp. Carnegie-2017]|uniref:uncharacterized protein LOC124451001 n=1 Tax=Xenia sp. Carnegie-2017 TaxID=2897299 RepID=UPI001F03642F|nr:uncharacterized protein LOC124451001 [Xenia sp. Carnegie-2017]